MTGHSVLIVDDEVAIRGMLRMALELAEFDCLEAGTIDDAHEIVVNQRPDIILLDWMLPGGSGLELLRRLKRDDATAHTPVIMLTAKATEDNMIQGLEVGADDYLSKPFAPRELIARMKALLRRARVIEPGEPLRIGALNLDMEARRVSIDEGVIDLGPTEFNLLLFFMSHPERAYSRAQILDYVWGPGVYVEERTVDVHIRRLRKALQISDGPYAELIQTVRGTGYRLSARDLELP